MRVGIDVRELEHRELGTVAQVAQATLANDHLGARTRYRDERGFEVELGERLERIRKALGIE